MAAIRIVGLDCATDDVRTGVALGSFEDGRLTLVDVMQCGRAAGSARSILAAWIRDQPGPTLLVIDAPLGWPAALSRALIEHRAGGTLSELPNAMFRRETDRFIKARTGKNPLDVGADRIARTAHAALRLIEELRGELGVPIAMAWQREALARVSAIEVYPAATLLAHGLSSTAYKTPEQRARREAMLAGIGAHVEVSEANARVMLAHADAFDAVVCLVAARDFLVGEAMAPEDEALAEREGWIWAKGPFPTLRRTTAGQQ